MSSAETKLSDAVLVTFPASVRWYGCSLPYFGVTLGHFRVISSYFGLFRVLSYRNLMTANIWFQIRISNQYT